MLDLRSRMFFPALVTLLVFPVECGSFKRTKMPSPTAMGLQPIFPALFFAHNSLVDSHCLESPTLMNLLTKVRFDSIDGHSPTKQLLRYMAPMVGHIYQDKNRL